MVRPSKPHLYAQMVKMALDAGLKVEKQAHWTKVTGKNDRRLYIKNTVGANVAHLHGFTVNAPAFIQLRNRGNLGPAVQQASDPDLEDHEIMKATRKALARISF